MTPNENAQLGKALVEICVTSRPHSSNGNPQRTWPSFNSAIITTITIGVLHHAGTRILRTTMFADLTFVDCDVLTGYSRFCVSQGLAQVYEIMAQLNESFVFVL
jgi:hypothetical protein